MIEPSLWAAMGLYALLSFGVSYCGRLLNETSQEERSWLVGVAWGIRIAVLLLAVVLSPGGTAPAFIYFQF